MAEPCELRMRFFPILFLSNQMNKDTRANILNFSKKRETNLICHFFVYSTPPQVCQATKEQQQQRDAAAAAASPNGLGNTNHDQDDQG